MPRVYGKRAMLNLPGHESVASIVAEIQDTDYGLDVCFAINDCNRTVHLNIGDMSKNGDCENALYKIDTMIDCLKALRRGVIYFGKRDGGLGS